MEFDVSKPIAGPCSGEVQVCSLEIQKVYVHAVCRGIISANNSDECFFSANRLSLSNPVYAMELHCGWIG